MAELQSRLILTMVDRVTAPARSIQGSIDRLNSQIKRTNAQIDAVRGSFIGAGAQLAAFGFAMRSPIKAAMDMESAMADVRKVVDFPTPEGLKEFQEEIVSMSTRIPIAAEGLASIAAAAGQAGIAAGDLTRFTEQAARIGVAFDISAEQAGDSMAKLMTGLNLSVDGVGSLADAMNHLSNAQASSASDILDVVNRVGASAKQFGFTAEEVAAFGSAMVASGAQSEVAATSFMNMGRALTKGGSATKRQANALEKLGLNSTEVAKRMQEDAVGTTIDVMERLAALPAEVRAAVSSDLFGDEARALGPLLTNLGLLRESVGMVADESNYAGSAQAEFANRMKTFGTRVQLLRNRFRALQISIGEALIPEVERLMDHIEPIIDSFRQWARDNPQLVATIARVTGALLSMRFAFLGLRLLGLTGKAGLLSSMASGLSAVSAVGRGVGGLVASSFAAVSGAAASASRSLKAFRIVAALEGVGVASGRATKSLIGNLLGLLNPIRLVKAAIAGLKYALIGSGIGIALLGIGAAGAFIARNWSGIKEMFSNVWTSFQTAIEPVKAKIDPVITALRDVWKWVWSLTGEVDASGKSWAAWGQTIGTWVGNTVTAVANGVQKIIDLIAKLNSAMSSFNPNLAPGAEFRSSPIGTVRKGSFLDKVTPGGTPVPAAPYSAIDIPQAKATGGFMRAVPTLVGERGPEMIYPSRAGWVAHAQQVSRMADVSQRLPQAQQALRMADVSRRLPQARSLPAPARQSAGARPVNVTFGSINVQGGANASPRQLADEFGRQARAMMRAHFSDEF